MNARVPSGRTAEAMSGKGAFSRLPPEAGRFLRRFAEQTFERWINLASWSDRRAKCADDLLRAEAAHRELEALARRGENFTETVAYHKPSAGSADLGYRVVRKPDAERMAAAVKAVEDTRAERKRIDAKIETLSEHWQTSQHLVQAVESYLQSGDLVLKDFAIAARPKATLAEVGKVRSAILAHKADLNAVIMAPMPTAAAKGMARRWAQALADRGAPKLYDLIPGAFRIEFPKASVEVLGAGGLPGGGAVEVRGFAQAVDPVSLLAWFDQDRLIAMLDREIEDVGDDTLALDEKTRAAREAEIVGRILEAEREEEVLIRAVESTGVDVVRRADADLRAFLGIDGPAPRSD